MKKIVLLIITILLLTLNVYATFTPRYMNSIRTTGIGVISLPQEFVVYSQPNLSSKVLKKYKWGNASGAIVHNEYNSNFVLINEDKEIALMSVVEDSESGEWYKVCYDQKNNLTGWVHSENCEFYSWLSFYKKYGKANGVYFFHDIPDSERVLYSQPSLNSQPIHKFKIAKDAKVQIFRGNWVLLKVYDYESQTHIGWFQWRTDNGSFKLFPNVK